MPILATTADALHVLPAALIPAVAILQQTDYGFWTTIIELLRGLVIVSGSVGFLIGMAVKANAGPNADGQALGSKIVQGSVTGIFVGLLAEPIYNLFIAWTSV